MNTLEMIAELRGGIPDHCDFCEQPYTEERYPIPEEAGMWTCSHCLQRWEKQDKCPHTNVVTTPSYAGEGAMEYIEWFDHNCPDCGKHWTANEE
jgi:ribosomal protein L37AE/L43A